MFSTYRLDVLIHLAGTEINLKTNAFMRLVALSPNLFLSLNHKSVCFTLPLLNKDRVQFKLNAIDFLSLPASESKYVIVERTAAVSADIEGLAVFLYFLHDFLGT